MKRIIILILSFIALSAQPATKEDIKELKQDIRLLINKVNEIDKKVYANSIKIDMLEKNMNKRFEQVDKRFEQVDKRFEDMNKRFEDMLNYLWMISAAFLGLTTVTIGFAIWDRKSTIKAVKDEIVEDIKTNKLKEFIYELKKLAKEDMELAKVLRSFHML